MPLSLLQRLSLRVEFGRRVEVITEERLTKPALGFFATERTFVPAATAVSKDEIELDLGPTMLTESWRRRESNGRFVASRPLDESIAHLGVPSLNFRVADLLDTMKGKPHAVYEELSVGWPQACRHVL